MKELDDITGSIIDEAIRIHRELGPGLLELVYEAVLAQALERRGLRVERQKTVSFDYDGIHFLRRVSARICWWRMLWSWN